MSNFPCPALVNTSLFCRGLVVDDIIAAATWAPALLCTIYLEIFRSRVKRFRRVRHWVLLSIFGQMLNIGHEDPLLHSTSVSIVVVGIGCACVQWIENTVTAGFTITSTDQPPWFTAYIAMLYVTCLAGFPITEFGGCFTLDCRWLISQFFIDLVYLMFLVLPINIASYIIYKKVYRSLQVITATKDRIANCNGPRTENTDSEEDGRGVAIASVTQGIQINAAFMKSSQTRLQTFKRSISVVPMKQTHRESTFEEISYHKGLRKIRRMVILFNIFTAIDASYLIEQLATGSVGKAKDPCLLEGNFRKCLNYATFYFFTLWHTNTTATE